MTLIDNIVVHSAKTHYNAVIVYISDHLIVAIHLKTSLPKLKIDNNKMKRSLDVNSLQNFNVHLAKTDCNEVYKFCCQ